MNVTLWHGTTAPAAQAILRDGFVRVDTTDLVSDTAQEHDVPVDDVRRWLTEWGRFAEVQTHRSESAWFCSSAVKARRWAERAPEARWESLWAIWAINHDLLDPYESASLPWAIPEAAAWHFLQDRDVPIAVVTVEVPVTRLQDRFQRPIAQDNLDGYLDDIKDGTLPEVSIGLPVDPETVVNVTQIERHVDFTAAAGLLGITTDELAERVDGGELPGLQPPEVPLSSHYWRWADFRAFLPSET